jgi:hypothetical protein
MERILNTENGRLPRGTRPVAQAFLVALDAVPAKSRQEVAKAALGVVKEGLALRKSATAAKSNKRSAAAKRAAPKPAARPAVRAKLAVARNKQAVKPKLTVVPKSAVA